MATRSTRCVVVVLAVAYVATVAAANWLTDHLGPIPVGFGWLVPAGTVMAGLALGLRDALQDAATRRVVLAAIVAGSVCSVFAAAPGLVVASAVAFLVAELADMVVYGRLRDRGHPVWSVVLSNTVGAAVDTWLFLWLAPFPITAAMFGGQMTVKAGWCTAVFLTARYGLPALHRALRPATRLRPSPLSQLSQRHCAQPDQEEHL